MPDEDEFLSGEFYSQRDLRRGFDMIVDAFVEDRFDDSLEDETPDLTGLVY